MPARNTWQRSASIVAGNSGSLASGAGQFGLSFTSAQVENFLVSRGLEVDLVARVLCSGGPRLTLRGTAAELHPGPTAAEQFPTDCQKQDLLIGKGRFPSGTQLHYGMEFSVYVYLCQQKRGMVPTVHLKLFHEVAK